MGANGREEGGPPRATEREVAVQVVKDEGAPEGVVGSEDVEGAAGSGEGGEVAGREEGKDVEEEVVRQGAKNAEAIVAGVDGGGGVAEEEEVAERLDGVETGRGGGLQLKPQHLLFPHPLLFFFGYLVF